jgi:hypothetical protein
MPTAMRRKSRSPLPGPADLAPASARRPWAACHAFLGLAVSLLALAGPVGAQASLAEPGGLREGVFGGWQEGRPVVARRAAAPGWLGLDLLPQPAAPADGPWRLELAEGLLLPGSPGLGREDAGSWRLPGGQALDFDSLWLRRVGRPLPAREAEEKDVLWLSTPGGAPDRLRGWLLQWRATGLVFEGPAGEAEYAWDRISGLEVLAEPPPARRGGGWCWVVLDGGGFLLLRPRDGGPDRPLLAEPPWGGTVELPWSAVAAVYPERSGLLAAAWRTAEAPATEVVDWSPKRGRSVEGRPLRCAGREYPDGWGVRVPTVIEVEVDGPGVFRSWVGVDDEVAAYRNPRPVRFSVELDGEPLAQSPPLRVGQEAHLLEVEVPRAGTLRLVARPEGPLPFGGHADWLLPRFDPAAR